MTPVRDSLPLTANLESSSVHLLLRMVGDQELGCRSGALDKLLGLGLDQVCTELESGVRNDGDADLRNGAMEVLVAFGAAAVPRLVALLQDDNEEVRNFSAVMLGSIGSREAVAPLVEALQDPDVNVQHAAAEALGAIGDRAALVPLLALLRGDLWQQFPAVAALGAMRDERAVPYLLPLVPDPLLGQPAMEALGKIGDPRALNPLLAVIASPDTPDCAMAVRAVVAIVGRTMERGDVQTCRNLARRFSSQGMTNLLHLLRKSPGRETLVAAVTLVGWLGDSAALPELLRLLEEDGTIEIVERAILAMGAPVIPALCQALGEPHMDVRIVAVRVLRWLGGIEDPQILLPLLDDGPAVQLEAVAALLGTTDDRFFDPLRHLALEGDPRVRQWAFCALAAYPEHRCAPLLEALAVAADGEWRRGAALLAGGMASGGEEVLLGLLRDPEASVRRIALRGAGERGLPLAIPVIRQALADDDQEVREEAVRALAAYRDPAFLPDLLQLLGSGTERLDQVVAMAAGQVGSPHAASHLVRLLWRSGNSRALEFTVIEALGKLGPLEESERRGIHACVGHEDADIRRLAITTLARLEGDLSLPLLEAACSDSHWSVRVAAADALSALGVPGAMPLLLAALEDADPLVRNHLATLLGGRPAEWSVIPLARLLTDSESGKSAYEALLAHGETAVPLLHSLVAHRDPGVSLERVVDLLGRIASPASIALLMAALEDADTAVRLAAIDSLVSCFDRTVREPLCRLAGADPEQEVRRRAELVLSAIGAEVSC
jgi:HEAT repeat protein